VLRLRSPLELVENLPGLRRSACLRQCVTEECESSGVLLDSRQLSCLGDRLVVFAPDDVKPYHTDVRLGVTRFHAQHHLDLLHRTVVLTAG
jgi:hypothetical protein